MAVAPSAAVSPNKTTTKKRKRGQPEKNVEEDANMKMDVDHSDHKKQASENPNQPKRTKAPGVRVVGTRVYDSENGRTCHQCRQKTLDFSAACVSKESGKQCTMKFCHKCLLNRYGEKAEEVAVLDEWKCPRCRGICNCSFCMKKRGCQPTGILVHTAKASGFTSVSEMLHVKDPEKPSKEDTDKCKDYTVASPKNPGKENLDGSCNRASGSQTTAPQEKKFKKVKDATDTTKKGTAVKNSAAVVSDAKKIKKKDLKEMKSGNEVKVSSQVGDATEVERKEVLSCAQPAGPTKKPMGVEFTLPHGNEVKVSSQVGDTTEVKRKEVLGCAQPAGPTKKPMEVEITLPHGTELTNVAGIDLPLEDVGNALQFLQFCYTFGEILEIRKGQAECVLRDIMLGRTRRGKVSSLVQFQIHLLTLIKDDMEEESIITPSDGQDCWLVALKQLVTESAFAAKDLAALSFERTETYDMLTSSEKLKLLAFLCDEVLDTALLRNWMDAQNEKFLEDKKEAREKLAAAREKEKLHKSKLLDERVKAIMAKDGAPLSIAEHEKLFSEAKAESERAHAEVLKAMGLIPQNKQTPDAYRTDPLHNDAKGHVYWRLKGCGKLDLLRQDIQGIDEEKSTEKWFSFEDKEIQVIDEYISSIPRAKKRKHSRTSASKIENGNHNPKMNMNEAPASAADESD